MNTSETINNLNNQSVFSSIILIAVGINIYIIEMYKDITIKGSSSKYTTRQIYNLALLSSHLFLISTIYFLIEAYEAYESSKSQSAFNFYMATSLSFIAQSIRVTTLIKYPEAIIGTQDII